MAELQSHLEGYQQALEGAAFMSQTETGYLRIAGPDRTAFIQRQTTNDINKLSAERAVLSVLTSPTARILDVLYFLEEPDAAEPAIGALTLPGLGLLTANYLKGRIFFMDKVTLEDVSEAYDQTDLLGPQAGEVLNKLGVDGLPEPNGVQWITIDEIELRLLALEPSFRLGYRLIIPVESTETIHAALERAGAVQLSHESYLTLRIEAGLPESGYELIGDYTPLETGLSVAVADSKGCYTGQEVIARQISYDKVSQSLVGLRMNGIIDNGERVTVDGKPVGRVTSTVLSPRFGQIALAVLRRPHNQPGVSVLVGPQDAPGVSGEVVQLPFQEEAQA